MKISIRSMVALLLWSYFSSCMAVESVVSDENIEYEFMGCIWVLESDFSKNQTLDSDMVVRWSRITKLGLQTVQFYKGLIEIEDLRRFRRVEETEVRAMGPYKVHFYKSYNGDRGHDGVLIKSEEFTINVLNFDKNALESFWQYCK